MFPIVHKSNRKVTLIIILLIFMSIFLNHSNIIFGINMSISDLFLFLLCILLILNRCFYIPKKEFLFFLLLSISLISTSLILIPNIIIGFKPNLNNIIMDYIKLIVLFSYFLLGYNVFRMNYTDIIIKWFSLATLVISFLAIFYTLFNITFIRSTFYFGENRFRGFMNDPNYFSILQLAGLVYFIRNTNLNRRFRFIAIITLISSIIISGSKTGLISLLIYMCIYTINKSKKSYNEMIKTIIKIMALSIIFLLFIIFSDTIIPYIIKILPSSERILVIFTDFKGAISGGGSSRNEVWGLAFKLFVKFPISGVGVGTYVDLGKYLYNFGALAHNTYLQIVVEWGIVLSLIYFTYLFSNLRYKRKMHRLDDLIVNDIIIIFLIGSLAISLNNARIFWLMLGVLRGYNRNEMYERRERTWL